MMKTVFVDSNVFIRFITADDVDQHKKAVDLVQKALSGKIKLVTGPPVFFEVAWTLSYSYKFPREQILDYLKALQAMNGLTVLDRDVVEESLDLALVSGQGFPDAYIAVSARRAGADAVATFNRRHFEKIGVNLYSL